MIGCMEALAECTAGRIPPPAPTQSAPAARPTPAPLRQQKVSARRESAGPVDSERPCAPHRN